jgi:hypothetical protein
MKFNLRVVLTVGCLCFLSRPIHGAGKYLQVEYPPSTATNQLQIGVTYITWVPDDVARFRCVTVHQHGAGWPLIVRRGSCVAPLLWRSWGSLFPGCLITPMDTRLGSFCFASLFYRR